MDEDGSRRGSGPWRRRVLGPVAAVVAAAVIVAPAAAIAPGLPAQFGGLSAANGPVDGLAATGSIETLYDSNALRSFGGSGLNPSGHIDDFRYSPQLTASYARETGRIGLVASGSVGHDFFQYNDYLNGGHYTGGGTITYRTGSSCQLSVNGNFASRQNGIYPGGTALEPIEQLPDDVGFIVDNIQTVSTYGANIGCGSPTGRLTLGAGYSHTSLDNAAATRRFANSDSDTYSGNIGLGILQPGRLSLTGSYSTVNYPDRAAALAGLNLPPQLLGAGIDSYQIGVAYSRPIGVKLRGSIGASYLHVDPGVGQSPYSAPAYNIGMTYLPNARLTVTLTGVRDAVPSTTAVSSYRITDQLQLNANYKLVRSITINANAAYSHDGYRNSFAIPGEPARLSLTTKTVGLGLTYAPRRLYDLTLNVVQSYRNSNPAFFNYDSTRAGLTLAVHYR